MKIFLVEFVVEVVLHFDDGLGSARGICFGGKGPPVGVDLSLQFSYSFFVGVGFIFELFLQFIDLNAVVFQPIATLDVL